MSLISSPGVYAVLCAQNILALPFAWMPNSTFNFAYVPGLHVPGSKIGVPTWHTINIASTTFTTTINEIKKGY